MYDLDHLNERTSAVKALFRALPTCLTHRPASPAEGSKSSYFSTPVPRKSIPSPTLSAGRHWNKSPDTRATDNAPASPSPALVCGIPTLTTTLPPNPTRGVKNLPPILRWPICSKLKTITAAATMATTRIITTEKPLLSLPYRSLRIHRSFRPPLRPVPSLAKRQSPRIHAGNGKKRTT